MTCFAHWTKRATKDTSGLFFWLDELLVSKDERDGSFILSVFDPVNHHLVLHKKMKTRKDWKRAYRLARGILKEEKIDCRSLHN